MNEYQLINPTTQIALKSFCIENCLNSTSNIWWKIYFGTNNNFIDWTILENTTQYIDQWIFGKRFYD